MASSVIPPMEHTYRSVTYVCSGEGFCKEGYRYDSQVERLIPPKTLKPGAKEVETKPAAYWKAQCAFRGLAQSGSIKDMQRRLKDEKKPMLPELKSAETTMNREFKKAVKAAQKDPWSSLQSAVEKARQDPHRFLREAFPQSGSVRPEDLDIVIIKDSSDSIVEAAEDMRLEAFKVDALWTSSKKPSPDRWIIVGRTEKGTLNQMREHQRNVSRTKQEFCTDKAKAQKPKQKATSSSNVIPQPPVPGNSRFGVRPSITTLPNAAVSRTGMNQGAPSADIPRGGGPRTKQTARKSAFLCPESDSSENESQSDSRAQPSSHTAGLRHGSVNGAPGPRTKQTARKNAFPRTEEDEFYGRNPPTFTTTPRNVWDVRGVYTVKYTVKSEEIKYNGAWTHNDGEPMSLYLFLEKVDGRTQLFGKFHFGVIEGCMRFQKPISTPKPGSSMKRKHDEIDEDGDTTMMDTLPSRKSFDGPTPYVKSTFYLGANDKPTARRPTWKYRWRGCDTAEEGYIQTDADKYVQTMTFSDKGNTLSGCFKSNVTGEVYFTGTKISAEAGEWMRVDLEEEWERYSEAAYDEARRNRWR